MSHFNQEAAQWDSEFKIQMMSHLASETIKYLKLGNGVNNQFDILDFGCGTGLFGLEFSDHMKTLTGIDTSTAMLEIFDLKSESSENISSILLNLEEEELDKKYDLVISSMTFHHLQDPESVLKKLKKMLNPGGRLAIVDLDKEDGSFHSNNNKMGVKHFGFAKDELEKWAQDLNMSFQHFFINEIEKEEKNFKQFLAIFGI